MPTNTKLEVPTWNQIYQMLLDQSEKIKKSGFKPDIIVAIARGGLVPGRILQDLLEVPTLTTIQIEYYVDLEQTRQEPLLKQALIVPVAGRKILLVDDVSDSGKSLELAKNHLIQHEPLEIRIAALYTKPTSMTPPEYYEKVTSSWVVFPWETKETIRKLILKAKNKKDPEKNIEGLLKAGLPSKLAKKFMKSMVK